MRVVTVGGDWWATSIPLYRKGCPNVTVLGLIIVLPYVVLRVSEYLFIVY